MVVKQVIDYKIIGQRVQKTRMGLGMTQESLAEKLRVSTNYLSKIETGREKPNLEMLAKISVAVDVSLADLLTGVVEGRQYLQKDFADILASCSPEKVRLMYDVLARIAQYE